MIFPVLCMCILVVYIAACATSRSIVQSSSTARVCVSQKPQQWGGLDTMWAVAPQKRNAILRKVSTTFLLFICLLFLLFTSISLFHSQTSPRNIIREPIFLTGTDSSRNPDWCAVQTPTHLLRPAYRSVWSLNFPWNVPKFAPLLSQGIM